LLTAIVTLLTVFSNTLTERVKFGLDRADLRQAKFAKLSDDLSIYLFDCELEQEYLEEGVSRIDLYNSAGQELNNSITELRKTEYSNRAIIATYWNADEAQEFEGMMDDIKALDLVLHELNTPPQDGFTPEFEKKVSADIGVRLGPLKNKVQNFLQKLQ